MVGSDGETVKVIPTTTLTKGAFRKRLSLIELEPAKLENRSYGTNAVCGDNYVVSKDVEIFTRNRRDASSQESFMTQSHEDNRLKFESVTVPH
jgi:hypothetical protein